MMQNISSTLAAV